ncbi:MAG TPA: hypothetical protein VHU92_16420, partial [Streptosporangiaceae bacterium]|nr:hypothetical protein [Streptosporangiaceae bacterium]
MDRETGPDTRPIARVVADRDPALPEPARPAAGGSAPGSAGGGPGRADLARPAPPDATGPGVLGDPRVPVWIRRAVLAL